MNFKWNDALLVHHIQNLCYYCVIVAQVLNVMYYCANYRIKACVIVDVTRLEIFSQCSVDAADRQKFVIQYVNALPCARHGILCSASNLQYGISSAQFDALV